jgi:hypothetical protein
MTVPDTFVAATPPLPTPSLSQRRRPAAPSGEEPAVGLVRLPTPEEQAYAAALAELEIRHQRATDLQVELETLKLDLSRFEAEYHARVGYLFVELDRVRLACDEWGRRIARLRANLRSNLAELEDDIAEAFAKRRADIHAEEAESRRYQSTFAEEQTRPTLAPDEAAELKRLYRDLARRFHPDLARSDDERQRCAEQMLRINTAYRDRDLSALKDIAAATEPDSPAFARQTVAKRLAWVHAELARLDGVIAGLRQAIERVHTSDTYQLWQRAQADAGLFDRLATGMTRELDAARAQLAYLKATYDELVAERGGR